MSDETKVRPDEFRPRRKSVVLAGSYLAATWFGVGYIRLGAGTIATATALPLYWLLRLEPMPLQLAVSVLIAALSVLCAHLVAADCGQDDPQTVVIDEVTGALVTLLIINSSLLWIQLFALALFRLFDIFKPWPVDVTLGRHAGFNVVSDDVIAGALSGLLMLPVAHFVS